jgi:hypothetical protein
LVGDRILVALGEAGVRLLARDGRTLTRFAVPAYALVISHHGDRALAVARRGDTLSVARIDVATRRSQPWGLVEVSAFAPSFDGVTWFVARGSEVLALDATAEGFEARWRVELDGEIARDVAASSATLTIVSATPTPDVQPHRLWRFDLPARVLRKRTGFSAEAAEMIWSDAGGGVVLLTRDAPDASNWRLERVGIDAQSSALTGGASLHVRYVATGTAGWSAVLCDGEEDEEATVRAGAWDAGNDFAVEVTIEAARGARARICGDLVVVADAHGRVDVFDIRTGALAAHARIGTKA